MQIVTKRKNDPMILEAKFSRVKNCDSSHPWSWPDAMFRCLIAYLLLEELIKRDLLITDYSIEHRGHY